MVVYRVEGSPLLLGMQGNGIRDSAAAAQLLQQVNFNGLTPLGTNLNSKVRA